MSRKIFRWLLPLGVLAVLLAVGLAHLASEKPDGLEHVAEKQGFAKKEQPNKSAPMPDYEVSAWKGPVGKTLAGLAGVALAFGLVLGLGHVLRRRRQDPTESGPDDPTDAAADAATGDPKA